MTPEDSRQVGRLVGFYEYVNALRHFDALLALLEPEEIDAVNKLIEGRDEFVVYTNLSRRVQQGRPSSLVELGHNEADRFDRRGLAWVTALARVEVGAMLAGFTSIQRPFLAVEPNPYDMAAYTELLQDGARTHVWALINDPALGAVTRVSPENTAVLSYSRRVQLAREMLGAAAQAGAREYAPIQRQELIAWKKSLDSLQSGFVSKIQQYLQTQVVSAQRDSQSFSQSFNNACGRMLQAERQASPGELQITPFSR